MLCHVCQAMACIRTGRAYCGITLTATHSAELKRFLAKRVWAAFVDPNDDLFEEELSEMVQKAKRGNEENDDDDGEDAADDGDDNEGEGEKAKAKRGKKRSAPDAEASAPKPAMKKAKAKAKGKAKGKSKAQAKKKSGKAGTDDAEKAGQPSKKELLDQIAAMTGTKGDGSALEAVDSGGDEEEGADEDNE